MYALLRAAGNPSAPLFSIAGKALIVRQLQWLRAVGCNGLVVELGDDDKGDAVASLLEDDEAVGDGVVLVSSAGGLTDRALARRGGVPDAAPFLVLGGDVIGDGDLTRLYVTVGEAGIEARFAQHPALTGIPAASIFLAAVEGGDGCVIDGPGWAARLRHAADARLVTEAVLGGRLGRDGAAWPIQVHATEIRPGVWISRGARVDAGAELIPPVLLGPRARVLSSARVGPFAVVGAGAIVGRGVTMERAEVDPDTLVADGLALADCTAGPSRMVLLDGDEISVDPLLLGRVSGGMVVGALTSRVVALLLLVLMAPAALLFGRMRSGHFARIVGELREVVAGRRVLVGVRAPCRDAQGASAHLRASASECPVGMIDVSHALVPADADADTELRARAWYAVTKSPWLDARLVLRILFTSWRSA